MSTGERMANLLQMSPFASHPEVTSEVDSIILRPLKVRWYVFRVSASFILHLLMMQPVCSGHPCAQRVRHSFLNQKPFIIRRLLRLWYLMILKFHSVRQEFAAMDLI